MQLPFPQPPNLSARTPPLQHTHTFAIHVSFMGDEELGNAIVSFRACQMQRCPAWVGCMCKSHLLIRTPYAQGSYAQYTLYTLA